MPVQLRFETGLTGADYVTREAWREARLSRCPLHPRGGCGFARHGTYERKTPAGTLIARWYCPQGLLPDHLAARFPGTLSAAPGVALRLPQFHTRRRRMTNAQYRQALACFAMG